VCPDGTVFDTDVDNFRDLVDNPWVLGIIIRDLWWKTRNRWGSLGDELGIPGGLSPAISRLSRPYSGDGDKLSTIDPRGNHAYVPGVFGYCPHVRTHYNDDVTHHLQFYEDLRTRGGFRGTAAQIGQ
jgi:hypothetical protein